MSRIFLRSVRAPSGSDTWEKKFESVFWNTGNLFFEDALERQTVGFDTVYDYDKLPEKIDLLLMSMSNVISPASNLEWFMEAIQRRTVRGVALVGIGAQANTYGDEINIHESVDRFLRFSADRANTIGVRGAYTAEWLSDHGIKNVEIIGCPSAFWTESLVVPNAKIDDNAEVAVHCTMDGRFREKVSGLLAHGIRYGAEFVIQTERWIFDFALAQGNGSGCKIAEYFAHPYLSSNVLSKWLGDYGKAYFDTNTWLEAMGRKAFVYGSRFHGNMVAIQTGVPALNLTFDTRTRELCEYLNLPHMRFSDFNPGTSLRDLADIANFSTFNNTLSAKRDAYAEFLERNGVNHTVGRDLSGNSAKTTISDRTLLRSAEQFLRDATRAGLRFSDELQKEVSYRLDASDH